MKNPAAELGKLSAKKRFKGKTKKQISEIMAQVSRARKVCTPIHTDTEKS
jgi:hypothetical protein